MFVCLKNGFSHLLSLCEKKSSLPCRIEIVKCIFKKKFSKKFEYLCKNIQFISDNIKTKDENGVYLGN